MIIIAGKGYSLMWPQGSEIQKFEWEEGSIIVPPDNWFHQHFNAGNAPARYLALRWGNKKFLGVAKAYGVNDDVKKGGSQIEYANEDPRIHREFEEIIAKAGAACQMGAHHPGCTLKAAVA